MNTKGTAGKLISFYNKFGIIFILILELIIFSVANSNFFTPNNLFLVGRQVSFYGIAGVGMTMVLLVGEIDISVGSILAFTGCLSATLMTQMGLSIPVAFLLTLLLCCVFGLVSGTLTAVLKIPSLIGTLAMQTIIKGFTYLMTGGSSVTGLSDRFKHLGQGFLFGVIPIPLIVMVVMFALGFLLLNRTFLGRADLCRGRQSGSRPSFRHQDPCRRGGYLCGLCRHRRHRRRSDGRPSGDRPALHRLRLRHGRAHRHRPGRRHPPGRQGLRTECVYRLLYHRHSLQWPDHVQRARVLAVDH